MTWLITGGCGFVGINLADALLGQGKEVVILDNLSRMGGRQNLAWLRSRHGDAWRFLESDIREATTVSCLVRETRPRALVHLAGQVAMTTSLREPRLDFEVNALGTLNVLEAVRLHSPETIVLYSSTNKVYGDLAWVRHVEHETRYVAPDYPQGFDESLPLSFCSPYGCSKGVADQYVLDYARTFGLRTAVFRHSSMYGGRQFATYDQGWIGWFCLKALEAKRAQRTNCASPPFTISGDGKQVRDILHVEDIIRLYLAGARWIDRVNGQAFNVGGGMANSLSLLELFALLARILAVPLVYEKRPWRQSDQKMFVADLSRIHAKLGWSPKIGTEEGIRLVLDWTQATVANMS